MELEVAICALKFASEEENLKVPQAKAISLDPPYGPGR